VVGYCIDCNYPLQGLTSNRCPECGRAFDPADPKSISARPVGPLARFLLRPPGRIVFVVAILASLSLFSISGSPVAWPLFSTIEFRLLRAFSHDPLLRDEWRQLATWKEWLYLISACMWLVIAIAWLGRAALGAVVRMIRQPPAAMTPRQKWRHASFCLAMLLGAAALSMGWQVRVARLWVAEALSLQQQHGNRSRTPPSRFLAVPNEERGAIFEAAVRRLPSPKQRTAGIKLLIEEQHDAAQVILSSAIAEENDPGVLATELRLLAMFRNPDKAPLIESRLDHADPVVRAAALDALGILYGPAYPIPQAESGWSAAPTSIECDPPILINSIFHT
jgi:hypothetical protein